MIICAKNSRRSAPRRPLCGIASTRKYFDTGQEYVGTVLIKVKRDDTMIFGAVFAVLSLSEFHRLIQITTGISPRSSVSLLYLEIVAAIYQI